MRSLSLGQVVGKMSKSLESTIADEERLLPRALSWVLRMHQHLLPSIGPWRRLQVADGSAAVLDAEPNSIALSPGSCSRKLPKLCCGIVGELVEILQGGGCSVENR